MSSNSVQETRKEYRIVTSISVNRQCYIVLCGAEAKTFVINSMTSRNSLLELKPSSLPWGGQSTENVLILGQTLFLERRVRFHKILK